MLQIDILRVNIHDRRRGAFLLFVEGFPFEGEVALGPIRGGVDSIFEGGDLGPLLELSIEPSGHSPRLLGASISLPQLVLALGDPILDPHYIFVPLQLF